MHLLNKIALIITIIGGLNWGLIALFSFNLVAWITGGVTLIENIIYLVVAASAIWCVTLLFQKDEDVSHSHA